ncbi:ABC transporter permease [Mycetocola reblochoni]|uniref:Dipeptide transport system permease protein DppC (TC 3.A.1.5.2) n=2 Tax=Mycetocola reblochoni TaxID=331618 RepID=A0A1R4K5Z1_9MICO|nr:ABC transporter permease [Mycetocola reblochoni]RLP68013.1 ABC transporter permease [Mycetocola reblochoni]SJN39658.1 Dipeptide transport system permease protein DppC (TC 3.A.1.5.2) [Mycetocola reblochoni REB411]
MSAPTEQSIVAGGTEASPSGGARFAPRARTRAERRRRVRPTVLLSWIVIAVAVAWAIAPGVFAPADPVAGNAADALQAPGAAHWFGTDATGRDMYSRVVHGAIHSLSGALIAVSVGLVVGTVLGVVAGAVDGVVSEAIMRLVDVLLAIPQLLLMLSIIIILGFGTAQAAVAVGITSIAAFARLARSEVVRVRRSDYVEAAYASGGRRVAVLVRHVLPNSLTAVVALAALQFGTAILLISTLGFLGYGAPPPTPEWGLMIAEGRNYVATSWWLTTLPGLVVVAVVISANRISSALNDRDRR